MAASNLTTKNVARLLDVSEATVKRWADDGLLSASKTAGGHRRFKIEEVARFRRERGISPGLAARQVETDHLPRPIVTAAQLRELLLSGDEARAADALIDSYLGGQNLSSLFDKTITDAMREIGDLWFKGELTVADEHLATHTILGALPKLKGILVPAEPLGLKAICCGIEDDLHELPVHLAGLILESEGWDVVNLGPNTPLFSLREMLIQTRPQLLCVSGKMLTDPDRTAIEYAQLRKATDKFGVPVVLGGEAFKNEVMRARFPATFYAEDFAGLVEFASSFCL